MHSSPEPDRRFCERHAPLLYLRSAKRREAFRAGKRVVSGPIFWDPSAQQNGKQGLQKQLSFLLEVR